MYPEDMPHCPYCSGPLRDERHPTMIGFIPNNLYSPVANVPLAFREPDENGHIWGIPGELRFITGMECRLCGAISDEESGRQPCPVDESPLKAEDTGGVIIDEENTMGSPREDIRENQKRLSSCDVPHNFTIDTTPEKQLGKRWKCEKCRGIIGSANKAWYLQGLRHAKKSS
jgi:hypothetical protein